jgi:hypothetical protein
MATRFWAFEHMFAVNNNLLTAEVYVGQTRQELVKAMQSFFSQPRAHVLLAEVLGAWFADGDEIERFYDAKPFVRIAIAGEDLAFTAETQRRLLGDLEGGGLSRRYLASGRGIAEDAGPEDADDDGDAELAPFELRFDAAGFLASLPSVDGDQLGWDAMVRLVRPVGVPGFPTSIDEMVYGDESEMGDDDDIVPQAKVEVGAGWSDANPGAKPYPFDPQQRFVASFELPMM